MKSRISFFNKTIFFKNIKLYFPISIIYLLLLILMVPVKLQYSFKNILNLSESVVIKNFRSSQYNELVSVLNLQRHTLLIFVFAVVIVMALFSYMFNSKSCYMIHSLPVTRKELFGTNVISAMLIIFIPQIITFVATQMVLLLKGFADIKVLGVWLVCVMAISLFAISMAVFCAMFTGQMFALPVYYGVLNVLYVGIRLVVVGIVNIFTIGTKAYFVNGTRFDWLSPFYYICGNVSISPIYDEGYTSVIGAKLYTGNILLIYSLVSLVMLLLAYVIYRRKPAEKAGDLLTLSFSKPIFRWGVGICVGFTIPILLLSIFVSEEKEVFTRSFLPLLIVWGIIAFFVADMFIAKSFKVFKKKRILESVAFVAVLILSFGILRFVSDKMTYWIPDRKNIAKAYVSSNFYTEYEGKDIDKVIEFQKKILDNYHKWNKGKAAANFTENISICYCTVTGERVIREYDIPSSQAICKELYSDFKKIGYNKQALRKYLFGDEPGQNQFTLSGIEIEYGDASSGSYEVEPINENVISEVMKALEQDIDEGNLDSMYLDYKYAQDYGEKTSDIVLCYEIANPKKYSDIQLRYENINLEDYFKNEVIRPNDDSENTIYYYSGNVSYEDHFMVPEKQIIMRRYISINENCKNILETLKRYNLIIF